MANNIKGNQGIKAIKNKYGIDTEKSKILKLQVYPQKIKEQYLPGVISKSNSEKNKLADFKTLLEYLDKLSLKHLISFIKTHKGISDEFEDLFSIEKKSFMKCLYHVINIIIGSLVLLE